MFDNFEDFERAFKEVDKQKRSKQVDDYQAFTEAFWDYFKALQKVGFTRREAMRLLEGYASIIYDYTLEQSLNLEFGGPTQSEED